MLETILRTIKQYSLIVLASSAFACSSCENDSLSRSPCIEYEICGDKDDDGNSVDNNCDGKTDEGCDKDGDGYCHWNNVFSYSPGTEPSVCAGTFEKISTGTVSETFDCRDINFRSYWGGRECENIIYDCDDMNKEINPGMTEQCNGYDDDCNGFTDESFPEYGLRCDPEKFLGTDFEKDNVGICKAGMYTGCLDGKLLCEGLIGPKDKEYCNNKDDDCDPTTQENQLTDAKPCYNGPLGTQDVGMCRSGVELCIDGVVGRDDECYGEILPEEEILDCYDNDCDGEIDEGFSTRDIDIAPAIDTSYSMNNYWGEVLSLDSEGMAQPCGDEEMVNISTILIGDPDTMRKEPKLKGSLEKVDEFSGNVRNYIPANPSGPVTEPSTNTVVYAACSVLDRPPHAPYFARVNGDLIDVCAMIRPYNTLKETHSFNSINRPVFRMDTDKTLVIISDEGSQWVLPEEIQNMALEEQAQIDFPYITPTIAAEMADAAGMHLVIYTRPQFDTLAVGGYGYPGGWAVIRDYGGEVYDINIFDGSTFLQDLIRQRRSGM